MEITFPFDVHELFEKCVKHKIIPRNDFEKQAILIKLLDNFSDNKKYSEIEVMHIIEDYFDDSTLLRRELVNFGYMQRDPTTGEYWVVKRVLTKKDIMKNTILKRHAVPYKVL